MRGWALALVTLLAACHEGPLDRPVSNAIADAIESRLTRVPCVGSMRRWQRAYRFTARPSIAMDVLTFGDQPFWFNYDRVEVWLSQAGFAEFRSRRVMHDLHRFGIDDREYRVAGATYNPESRRLILTYCGQNVGGEELHFVVP